MNDDLETMKELDNWVKVTKGIYIYAIAPQTAYEIQILYVEEGDLIENAKSRLYIVGDWHDEKTNKDYFEREWLFGGNLKQCLEEAYKDHDEHIHYGHIS